MMRLLLMAWTLAGITLSQDLLAHNPYLAHMRELGTSLESR